MLEGLKQRWHQFRDAPRGERFQQSFKRRQRARHDPLRKVLVLAGGFVIMAAGLFFLPFPGPGVLILSFGAALVAQEWFVAARALDWMEVRLWRLLVRALAVWRRSAVPVRILLMLMPMAFLGAAAVGAFKLLSGG